VASATVGALRILLSADTAAFEKALSTADASTKKLANTMKKDLEPSQARINGLVRQFAGSKEIGQALNYAKAVEQVGGASKLTAQHQEKVNASVQKALTHYKALGQQAPPHLIALADATKKVEQPTNSLLTNLSKFSGVGKMLAGAFGISFAGLALSEMASLGKQLTGLQNGFENLAKGAKLNSKEMLSAMQEGTMGMVNNIDLMTAANKAMLLGLPVSAQEMGKLASAATTLGRAMGLDATQAFDNLVTALGRVSPLILDNLGITVSMDEANRKYASSLGKTVDALSEVEKKQAFYNEAMRKIEERQRELGEITLTSTEQMGRAWVSFQNVVAASFSWLDKTLGEGIEGWIHNLNIVRDLMAGMPGRTQALAFAKDMAKEEIARLAALNAPVTAGRWQMDPKVWAQHLKDKADAEKEAAAAAKKHAEALREVVEVLTGKNLVKRAAELNEQVRAAGGAAKITAPEIKKLSDELWELHRAGVKLDPVLRSIMDTTVDFSGKSSISQEFKQANAEIQRLIAFTDDFGIKWGQTFTGDMLGNQLLADRFVDFGRIEHAPQWVRDTEWLLKGAGSLPKVVESGFKKGMEAAFAALPQTILGAFQGGGNVGQSIGGLIGGGLLKGIGDKVGGQLAGSFLGKGLGAAVGSVIPGVGTLLGGLFGGALDNLFGGEGRRVNDLRDQFMAAQGGLEGVHKTIAQFGNDPQLMAAFNRLYFTGKEGDFNKGMDAYQKRLREIQTALGEVGGKLSSLTSAASAFGGVLPNSLKESAKQLLGMTGLTAEMRKQLEALTGQPSWKVLEERADALGIDKGALGAGFNQSKVKDLALGFVRDITMFTEAGADADGVLRGMADEISGLLVEAAKTGAQLPKTLEPYIKRLGEMGLLIDENGNAIDMGAFSFADFQDDALIAMKDLLTEIKDILAKAFPAAASAAARAIGQMGDAARGAFGGFRTPTFGSPEQGLHGWSLPDMNLASMTPSVSPASDFSAEAFSASGQMMTVIYQADGRELSRTIMPYIGGETRRLGLAPR
jgi:hypothetical protein